MSILNANVYSTNICVRLFYTYICNMNKDHVQNQRFCNILIIIYVLIKCNDIFTSTLYMMTIIYNDFK